MLDLRKLGVGVAQKPTVDGAVNEYTYPEVTQSPYFNNPPRKIIFINGMQNSGEDHVRSALALSWVQMCTVIGIYNLSSGLIADFAQCVADKNQFNGPRAALTRPFTSSRMTEREAVAALARNRCQVSVFEVLRRPENRQREIFAHSQGNLILSNALQAIAAVEGPSGVSGRVVNTFGSPAANWPAGIIKREHGFSADPVTWLAGFDWRFNISKVGMPLDSANPLTHSFLEYMTVDPEFLVNRFRWGGLRMTLNLDEDGLAECLADMGGNLERVRRVFEHLDRRHNSDVDDVAVRYVGHVRKRPELAARLRSDRALRDLLIKAMDEGYTSAAEKDAITYLRSL